jgi:hypothetical protein
MDQNALYNPLPPIGQNENNILVTCPYCNQTMKEDILNDHLLGHELENEDNLNSKNDLNNQNQNQNYDSSSYYGPDRRNIYPNSEPRFFNNSRPNIPPNNSNNQNNNFLSNLFSSIFNNSSVNQNNNSSQINNNNNNNNNGNNENNPGFFNSLFGINPNRNNNEPQNNNNNINNNSNNNNVNNNNPQSLDNNNIIEGISNTIGEIGKNLSSRLLNSLRSNQLIRENLLDHNPLRIMRMNPQYQNNRHYDYTTQINQIYVPDSNINNQIIIMRPPIIMAEPGQILVPGEIMHNNLSDDELNRIMGCLPSSIVNEKIEGENNNCVICLGDFEKGDSVTTLPCAHMFHTDCIKTWLKSNNHCPVCKFEITLNSLMREN